MKTIRLKNRPRLVLGVTFTAHCVRLMLVKQKLRGTEICNHAELDISLKEIQNPGFQHDLKALLEQWGITSNPIHTCVILPEEAILQIEVDKGLFDKTTEVDANRLFETTLFRPDEVYFDLKPSPSNPKKQILLLAKRDLVDGVIEFFSEIGIRVDRITSSQVILANHVQSCLHLKGEAILGYIDGQNLIWCAYSRAKLVAGSYWPCADEDKVLPLLRLACHEAMASLGNNTQPTLFLAGSKASTTLELLAKESTVPDDEDAQLPVHVLKSDGLLPPELNWGFLPIYLAVQKGKRSPRNFNLTPQPEIEPFLARSSFTKRLAVAAGILALVLAGQLLGHSMMIGHQATERLEDIQIRLEQTKRKISVEEKKLTELDWLIQANSSQTHLLPSIAKVIRRLPSQAWLEKYQWKDGKAVFHVAGIDRKKVKFIFSRTGSMSSDSAPKALKPNSPGVQLWQVSMSIAEKKKQQKQATSKNKCSTKKVKQFDSIRPSAVQK